MTQQTNFVLEILHEISNNTQILGAIYEDEIDVLQYAVNSLRCQLEQANTEIDELKKQLEKYQDLENA